MGKLRFEPKPRCSVCGQVLTEKHFNVLCMSVVWESIVPIRTVGEKLALFDEVFSRRTPGIGWLPFDYVYVAQEKVDDLFARSSESSSK